MIIFILFRPNLKKTRFLTDYQERTRKGQEKTRKGQEMTRKDKKGREKDKGFIFSYLSQKRQKEQ
jgi:hypothetical protein